MIDRQKNKLLSLPCYCCFILRVERAESILILRWQETVGEETKIEENNICLLYHA